MKNLSKFQIIFLASCLVVVGIAVITLAMSKGGGSKTVKLTAWGTMDSGYFSYLVTTDNAKNVADVTYVQKNPSTFYNDYIEAVADGVAPDMLVLDQSQLYKFSSKILHVPYTSYSERMFLDTFVQGSSLFKDSTGVLGFPFAANPLVMYWNKDIFAAAGIAQPPAYWDQFYTLATTLSKRDAAGNISQSAVALGGFNNIDHAKAILSALILQGGGSIVDSTTLNSTLENNFSQPVSPTVSALNFYTQFIDPTKSTYSWNTGLPSSEDQFIAGKLAVYFGPASDYKDITLKNPNLNFDVGQLPQAKGQNPLTYADFYAIAISKNSLNISPAFTAIQALISPTQEKRFSVSSGLPPAENAVLSAKPSDAIGPLFYNSTIIAKSWLDPDFTQSDSIFGDMITAINSGALLQGDAISRASTQLSSLFNKNNQ